MSDLCPECSSPLEDTDPRFVTWCRSCDWNVRPTEREPRRRPRLPRLQQRLVRDLHDSGVAKWNLARAASYALALLIHLLTLTILVTGIRLLVAFNFLSVIVSLPLLGLAWLMRPRFGRLPKDAEILTRQDAPRLFELLDEVAAGVNARRTHVVVLRTFVNAAYGTYGVRRRGVLHLGYPLWLILTPQERIALLGHELGHSSNGDSRHGLVIGTAAAALTELYSAAVPTTEAAPEDGLIALISHWLAELVLGLIRLITGGLYKLLVLLTLRSSQRAEYRADAMAADLGGTRAALGFMDALDTRAELATAFLQSRAVVVKGGLWVELEKYLAGVPESEYDRRRRAGRLTELRVDETHPPSYLRYSYIESLPYGEPRISVAGMASVDAELGRYADRVERACRDEHHASLYS